MKKLPVTIISRNRSPKENSRITESGLNYIPEFRALSDICLMAGFNHECDSRIVPILKEAALQTGSERVIVFEKNDSENKYVAKEATYNPSTNSFKFSDNEIYNISDTFLNDNPTLEFNLKHVRFWRNRVSAGKRIRKNKIFETSCRRRFNI